MKIKTYVDQSYNIDTTAVMENMVILKKYCDAMVANAENLSRSVPEDHSEIVATFYQKTTAITSQIISKLNFLEQELNELVDSGNEFADKIEDTKTVPFPM